MKWLFVIAALAISPAIMALLAPLPESIVELKTILNSPELGNRLDTNETISEIRKTEAGYVVKTDRSLLSIQLDYVQTNMPGPQKFTLKFSSALPLQ